jgi:hypothetical protein
MPTVTVKLTRDEIDTAIRQYIGDKTLPDADDSALNAAKVSYTLTSPKKGAGQLTGATVEVKS